MGFLGIGNKKPLRLNSLELSEKVLFNLERKELREEKDIKSNLHEAKVIIHSAIENTKHVMNRLMHNHPIPHDLDFEIIAKQFISAAHELERIKPHVMALAKEAKEFVESATNLERELKEHFASSKYSKKELKDLEILKSSEFSIVHDIHPIEVVVDSTIRFLNEISSYIHSLEHNVHRPKDHGDYETIKKNTYILHEIMWKFTNLNRDIASITRHIASLEHVIHSIHERLKSIKIEERRLEKDLRVHPEQIN